MSDRGDHDRGDHIEADLGWVVLACVAILVALVIVKALRVLVRTQWWEDHSWPLHLAWCRPKAAVRVLRDQPAWRCGICGRGVVVEHDMCRGCTLDLRDAWLAGEPYDWDRGGL